MFSSRSTQKELLDGENIPEQDLFQNLKELDFINHWLGGYNISFSALREVLKPTRKYTFVDIGCGGGDTLKRIGRWNKSHRYQLDLYGIDLKPVCIRYAEIHREEESIRFICDDYLHVFHHLKSVDVIHACLFCHHLSEEELVALVKFAVANKAILIINDLERNPLAYYAIKYLTQFFSSSYLVKNDAPLSVLRGFRKKEWLSVLKKSEASRYTVRNKWAFRHEVIIWE